MLVTLKDILKSAQKNSYIAGLFNAIDSDTIQGVIAAAEELRSPIILGTAEVLLPYAEFDLISPMLLSIAKKATVPVAVHFDHGLSFECCMKALELGFTGVMFDGSTKDYKQNITETREIVKIAHCFGASVEGEIGHVGEAIESDNENLDLFTTKQEALDYIHDTGVDALAIAVGTAHGQYKSKPKLDFDRIVEIRNATEVPLVLHGGSGLSDDDFRKALKCGISKVNIYTDICLASESAINTPNKGYIDVKLKKIEAVKEMAKRKMILFGSNSKA